MTADEIRKLLNSPEDPGLRFIADHRQYEREIIEGYTMQSVPYAFELDKYAPAKLGQVTAVVGHPNIGKTTVLLYLFAKLMKSRAKVLVYSAENRISALHKQVARFYSGKPNVDEDLLMSIRSNIQYIKHEKHFSYKEMLTQATYLLDAGFEYDFFLIDPYNSLRIHNPDRLNMHDYHYAACDEMRIFTTATNKSIFLNTHTVTEAQRAKLDINGHKPAPQDSDVEGGGKFINKADDTMVFHRQIRSKIQGEKYITEIHVTKVRNQEYGGSLTEYDSPIRVKFRIDRTGFDLVGSFEEKVDSIKQMNFYERE